MNSPNYKTNDPLGWCGDPSRGAALGRPTIHDAGLDFDGHLALRAVRLDSGGYDPNGTYFGIGSTLYWYSNNDASIDGVVRAGSRDEAKAKILKTYPKVRFYR
jgi:hypothetical protein